jgi:hypothetical protein
VGTSYHTLLVLGDLREVGAALAAAGVDGLVARAGRSRTAVIPRDDGLDPIGLAELVSGDAGFAALSNVVIDSDVVVMRAYRHGRLMHEYVSDQAMLVDRSEHSDARRFRAGGVDHPAGAPSPTGPRGADPVALAPFGVDPVDIDRLGAALRGEFSGHTPAFAEFQHRLILKAMNLEPRGLTTEFRWATVEDLPGGVRIRDLAAPMDRIAAVLHVGLPAGADPMEAAQVLANAVVGGPLPMRADVGYVAVIPAAIAADWPLTKARELLPAPQRATYFVVLHVRLGDETPNSWELLQGTLPMWTAALGARYGLATERGPVLAVIPSDQFDVGFRAARGYRSSRTAT